MCVGKSQHAVSGFHYGAAGDREWVCFVLPQQQTLFHITISFSRKEKMKDFSRCRKCCQIYLRSRPIWISDASLAGRRGGCLSLGTLALQWGWQPQSSSLWKGPEFSEEGGHGGTKECLDVLDKGIPRRRKLHRSSSLLLVTPLLVHGCHYLTWCEPTAGSLWSLYQDKEGKESLTSWPLYTELSRFTAALTYCSFLSTEYVLSVQCCVLALANISVIH